MGQVFKRRFIQIAAILITTLLYNEFLVYYIVLFNCYWPTAPPGAEPLRTVFIADTHLLGPSGHWWDRLRREWQMQRTFQTSLQLHSPDVVFILGDLFDDGKWSSDAAFQEDVRRFKRMFRHPESVKVVSLVGNHDIGFHYMINPHKRKRFVNSVNSSDSVRMLRLGDLSFVTVNSMAFEGDSCIMCTTARKDLSIISQQLSCAKNGWPDTTECSKHSDKTAYTAPILLQHFPMYRESDGICKGIDSTPDDIKYIPFREGFDCLSKDASNQIMDAVNPRLIISGHTHYFCLRQHSNGVEEWTVPSFSWRNIKGPSYLMASLWKDDYAINKCYMPNENTVYLLYFTVISAVLMYLFLMLLKGRYSASTGRKLKQ